MLHAITEYRQFTFRLPAVHGVLSWGDLFSFHIEFGGGTMKLVLITLLALVALPQVGFAQQQEPPGPFSNIGKKLKAGQTAEITDNGGQTFTGKVVEVLPASIVIMSKDSTRQQTFEASNVSKIRRKGPIWDGAIKGAAIAVIPVGLGSLGCHDCGLGAVAGIAAAFGAGIGLGIDALVGPKTVYKVPKQKIVLSPLVSKDRKGVTLALRF